jgi:putative alpha-1,2-mannosidase
MKRMSASETVLSSAVEATEASLRVVGQDTLIGERRVHQWADGRVIYFALKVSRPFAAAELYSNDLAVQGATHASHGWPRGGGIPDCEQANACATAREVQGSRLKCILHFPDAQLPDSGQIHFQHRRAPH